MYLKRAPIHRLQIKWIAIILMTLLWGLTISTPSNALSTDQYKPYYVTSKIMISHFKQHRTIYLNHVIVTQGTTRLTGDKVIMHLSKDNSTIELIEAIGNLAHYSTLPDHKKKKLYAQAKRIYFSPIKHTVLLIRDGKVTQDNNTFTGPHIWYDISTSTVLSTALGPNSHTVIIIKPQQKQSS